MKKTLYILLLVCCQQFVFSQNKCDNIIEGATDLYNTGRYDECIKVLEEGLKTCALSKGKKEKAFILLINSNIEKDSIQAVDKNFKALLVNRPNFKLKDYDVLDDFKEKFKNYFIYPKLSVGLRFYYGKPKVWLDPISKAGSRQVQQNLKKNGDFRAKEIYNINVSIDYRATEKWGQFSDVGVFTLDYKRELLNNYWTLNVIEQLKYFQWDMGTKRFYRSQKKLTPYLMTGLSSQFLFQSNFSLTQTRTEVEGLYTGVDTIGVQKTYLGKDISALRNHYTCYLMLGGGGIYNFGNVSIGFDFRFYALPFITLNNQKQRFKAIPELTSGYSYIDNDIIMTRSDISLTVSYNISNKAKNKK